jgi:alpha-ketoglutarate-dependent taurine dioxygenase
MTATMPLSSVVEVEAGDDTRWWEKERDDIRAVLVEHFGGYRGGGELPESPDPEGLRWRLRDAAPRLSALTDRIHDAFESKQACAVLVPKLGVTDSETDVDEQRRALYAFSALLGDVMANHPQDSVVWDVRDRAAEMAKRPKASDSNRQAGYHTDAGYLRMPPKFFLLYASHQAECGGGESVLRDGRVVLNQLAETERGRAAIRALRRTVPRRVPDMYADIAFAEPDGFQYSSVIGDKPLWRWSAGRTRPGSKRWGEHRPDSQLLARDPDYSESELAEAIETVLDLLKNGPDEIRLMIPTDGVMVIDNHVAMHGRSSFTDPRRRLFRIRFHEQGTGRNQGL